jgi:topoisomerase-4 subunit A
MDEDGNTHNKPYRKSAKSVGNVMGNYHPHGDSSIYEAMVRMSQDWKIREPLIDMNGNNGSIDDDPAAAMRYTEARLSSFANEMLNDLDKETVDMVLNFDDTRYEPTVLPTKIPNLLVNGATGISAGYATEIPTHNLAEIIDAIVHLLAHPKATTDELMEFVKGPDFPTGGIVQGLDGIKEAYNTGKGRIIIRSKTQITELKGGKKQIEITEIPYGVVKSNLVRKMDGIRLDKEVPGMTMVRDDSSREGLSIVIELTADADTGAVLNYLYKKTDLQISYNFNMVAIHNQRPERVGLKTALQAYIDFRKEVITKRTQFDLKKAMARQHIVEGLIKMLSILDAVIETIRGSENRKNAKDNLVSKFQFTEEQAEAIVTLQLYRLTNTDVVALQNEHDQLTEAINTYNDILANESTLKKVLRDELKDISKRYGSPRRSEIQAEIEEIVVDTTALVAEEEVVISVSKNGYVKRSSIRSFNASKPEDGYLEDDYPILRKEVSTLDHLMMFTNYGNMIYRPVHELVDGKWKDNGSHLSQEVNGLAADEIIIQAIVFNNLDFKGNYLVISADGMAKQVNFQDLLPSRTYKKKASSFMKLKGLDKVVFMDLINKDKQIVIATKNGQGLRYEIEEIPELGSKTAGVKGIDLSNEDQVAFVATGVEKNVFTFLNESGQIKTTPFAEIPATSRARKGVSILKAKKGQSNVISVGLAIKKKSEVIVYTTLGKSSDIVVSEKDATGRLEALSAFIKTSEGEPASIQIQTPILKAVKA